MSDLMFVFQMLWWYLQGMWNGVLILVNGVTEICRKVVGVGHARSKINEQADRLTPLGTLEDALGALS